MPSHEEQQRQEYFDEFGRHLARRHARVYAARAHGESAADPAAQRLGRYLQAARREAGLTPAQLAARAGITLAALLALEQGLIAAADIKPRWLSRLAAALNADAGDFQLLLGQPTGQPRRRWLDDLGWLRFSPGMLARPIYATLSAIVLSAVIGLSLLSHGPGWSAQPQPYPAAAPSTLVHISPTVRLNMIRAEKQKVLLYPAKSSQPVHPLPVAPDFNHRVDYITVATAPDPVVGRAFNWFDNPVLALWALTSFTPEGRFNLATAEYRVENQIWVQPKFISITSENRLNMVKAEIQL